MIGRRFESNSKGCRLLERCNNDWANILKDIQDDDRTEEKQRYSSVAEGETGVVVASTFQTREHVNSSLDQVDTKMILEVFIKSDAKW